ncbi:uncharacterized protein LOC142343943 isoform X2 [Convolutriloba macropyga]|uniref:uncharacterized protein LOC142343943 isoform X2 n=1 Tax=Convolutriloba macropyga TaxID=536237 RepID=UPI003F521302
MAKIFSRMPAKNQGEITTESLIGKPVEMPALGNHVELGDLFDASAGMFFGGLSPWNTDEIQKTEIENPDIQLKFVNSASELRKSSNNEIDGGVEGSFSVKAKGGFKLALEKMESSESDMACVALMYTKQNRMRRIPMEVIRKPTHMEFLSRFSNITHFVAEVTEGAAASILFMKSCESAQAASKISGELKGDLQLGIVAASGHIKVERKSDDFSKYQGTVVHASGLIEDSVTTIEAAKEIITHLR